MKCFMGQSLRGTGGFFGLVIFIHGLLRVCNWKKHSHHIADTLAVWEMAYSSIVTGFFADPYVDTLPNILVLFILTEWFVLLEEKSEDTVWYGFYCLLAVFAIVCKTSVAMIVLLPRICVYAGLVYWFFTIPQVKYCWGFLIFPVAVIPMYYWEKTDKKLPYIDNKDDLGKLVVPDSLKEGFYFEKVDE